MGGCDLCFVGGLAKVPSDPWRRRQLRVVCGGVTPGLVRAGGHEPLRGGDGSSTGAVSVPATFAQQKACAGTASFPPVYFVLGGPGSGKGTQCKVLVQKFGLLQICAGDLLREKAKDDDDVGRLVADTILSGQIVPGHITIDLLRDRMKKHLDVPGILIDGFPREMNQATEFEKKVVEARAVIYFSCAVEAMKSRGLTSGRADDDSAVIEKRLRTFFNVSLPVVEYYRSRNSLQVFDADRSQDAVFEDVSAFFASTLVKTAGKQERTL